MAFFRKKEGATATKEPEKKVVKETKNTCNQCGKVWYYGKKDIAEQKNAKLANASKGLLCCSGCAPALLIHDKKVTDLNQCPQCHSRDVKSEEVSYEVAK